MGVRQLCGSPDLTCAEDQHRLSGIGPWHGRELVRAIILASACRQGAASTAGTAANPVAERRLTTHNVLPLSEVGIQRSG